jgi:hypothetical protein
VSRRGDTTARIAPDDVERGGIANRDAPQASEQDLAGLVGLTSSVS